jgi:hypothetical protein
MASWTPEPVEAVFCYLIIFYVIKFCWTANLYILFIISLSTFVNGDFGSTVIKVLRYKSGGSWFDLRRGHWNFSST